MTTEFVTPVGRLVQGDPLVPQDKDNRGQPLVVKTGPNAGQPIKRYFVAIAIRKDDPEWPAFHAKLTAEARAGYPQLFNAQGQCTHPRFAWKIADGDGVDNNGQSNANKDGFAGCWVIKLSSQFAPKLLDSQGQYLNDAAAIKRGYYVRAFGNTSPNTGAEVPGLYVNHVGIQLCGYGPEIVGGPDVAAAFAAAAPVRLPPGASAQPMAPVAVPSLNPPGAPMAPPGAMPTPPVQQYAPQPPAATMTPPQPPAMSPPMVPPAPNYGFVQGAVAGGMPPAAPAVPQYAMTPAAQGWSREEWNRSGHTDEMLLAQGLMIRTA